MSTDRELVEDLRRLMHPQRQPALAPAQARGALASERGYAEIAQRLPGGGGGGAGGGSVLVSTRDSAANPPAPDPLFIVDPQWYPNDGQTMGHPFHGLVKDGTLTLPNAQAMSYPQPAASDTFLIDLGAPAVTRTVGQQASDTANGWQWWNQAVLSGHSLQLYGKTLNGWVLKDSTGARWLVSADLESRGAIDFTATLTANVTLARFGEFGAPAAEYTISSNTLADVGQSAYPELPTTGTLRLVDISPDGGRAVFKIVGASVAGTHFGRIYVSLGFLELALSGTEAGGFSATLSVLYDRTATLGTVTNTEDPLIPLYTWLHSETQTTVANSAQCGGGDKITSTPQDDGWLLETGAAEARWDTQIPRGSYSRTESVVGRILSVWYVGAVPTPVRLDLQSTITATASAATSVSGSYVYCSTGSTLSDDRNYSLSATGQTDQQVALTLSFGAQSVSDTLHYTESYSWDYSQQHSPGTSTITFAYTTTEQYTWGALQATADHDLSAGGPDAQSPEPSYGRHIFDAAYTDAANAFWSFSPGYLFGGGNTALIGPAPDGSVVAWDIWSAVEWANHVMGFAAERNSTGLSRFTASITPGQIAAAPAGSSHYIASWCPVTDQVGWDDPGAGLYNVCWV